MIDFVANQSHDSVVESLTALFVLGALALRYLGKERAAGALFAIGLLGAVILFHTYATDALKLSF
ncbi:hypothetical protein BH09VER1_BH09VER1_52010 [soil metagenome]